jgi:hypothetical protein
MTWALALGAGAFGVFGLWSILKDTGDAMRPRRRQPWDVA